MIIYGLNPVKDFINLFPNKISTLFISKNKLSDSEMKSVVNINTVYVSDAELKRITGTTKHQSLAAEIDMPRPKEFKHFKNDIKNMSNIVLILDHIKDPQNFGAITRTSVFFGINTIIIQNKRSDTISPGSVKASAGAIFGINIYEVPNLANSINELKKNKYWILGADIDGKDIKDDIFNKFIGEKLAIVFGSEEKGISSKIRTNCDFLISIGRLGKTNSLNVGVATGIFLNRFIHD